jgi:hypothetical protein
MFDALIRARRFRRCALKSQKLADESPSHEVAKRYRLIGQHYLALARLVEEGQYPEQSREQCSTGQVREDEQTSIAPAMPGRGQS